MLSSSSATLIKRSSGRIRRARCVQRSGRAQVEVTKPMLHGTQLEPLAREAYEQLTGHVMQPLVLVAGDYSASLDGMATERDAARRLAALDARSCEKPLAIHAVMNG